MPDDFSTLIRFSTDFFALGGLCFSWSLLVCLRPDQTLSGVIESIKIGSLLPKKSAPFDGSVALRKLYSSSNFGQL